MTDNTLAQMIAEAQDAKAFFTKHSQIGDSITGTITAISIRQSRDFRTKKPESWEDGSPKQQIVIIVEATNEANGETDTFSIYVRWWGIWRKAFAKAIADAKKNEPAIGGQLTVTYTGEIESEDPSFDPTKVYSYEYVE